MYVLGTSGEWQSKVQTSRKKCQRHRELRYPHHQRKPRSPSSLCLRPSRRRARMLAWERKVLHITLNPLVCNFFLHRSIKRGPQRQLTSTLECRFTHRWKTHHLSECALPSNRIPKGSKSSPKKKYRPAHLQARHPPQNAKGRTDQNRFGRLHPPQI